MRFIRAVGALVVLAALVIGIPAMLIMFVGNPWPETGIRLDQPFSDEAIIGILAATLWVLWAQLLWCIGVEIRFAIKDGGVDHQTVGTFGFQQQIARVLISSVVFAIGSSTMINLHTDTVAATTSAAPAFAPTSEIIFTETTVQADPEPEVVDQVEAAEETLTVHRGDTLWALAEKHLGDGAKFVQIVQLNEGHTMTDGRVFRATDPIITGWELRMPAHSTYAANERADGFDYTVKRGDTLSQIALDHEGDAGKWPEIFEKSKMLDQPAPLTDPDLIYPGQRLDLPSVGPAVSPAQTLPPNTSATPDIASESDKPRQVQAGVGEPPSMASPRSVEGGVETQDAEPQLLEGIEVADATEDDGSQLPGWAMSGLLGAGALLAGSMLLMLRSRRASQHRVRRPGRTLTSPDPQSSQVEKSVSVVGATATNTVEVIDELLKRLAVARIEAQQDLPDVAAVEVTTAAIAIHLKVKANEPPTTPWAVSDDGLLWVIDRDINLDTIGTAASDSPAPWPLLVTIGHDDASSTWLLNIEDLNVVVTGDSLAVTDFARFIAAEIACNPWSRHTALDLVDVATEIEPISPDRIHIHKDVNTTAAQAVTEAVNVIDRLAEHDVDTPTARAQQKDPDPWPSRVLIAGHDTDVAALTQLTELIANHGGRTATSVVLSGPDSGTAFAVHIDERRQLNIPSVNLTVTVVGLTADEAHGCAALLTQADERSDSPALDLPGDLPWQTMATSTGSLRDQYRVGRAVSTLEPSASLLDEPDLAYTSVAATTVADLEALAPKVTERTRQQVHAADPDLDDDLAAWVADDCSRPRLSLLGPVGARTGGIALARRKPFYTELLAYLVSRPYGATTDEVATAFDLTTSRVRIDINSLRDWLGVNPTTGEKFLPDARHAPAAQERGVGVYQVVDALVDADLFRRLRIRGESSGPDGIEDLVHALQLVTGRPYEKLRPGGWGWLLEGDRADQHLICAIADVAHVVVAHSLHIGDLDRAGRVAAIAVTAAPDEEVARLDLATVLEAQGHKAEAERIVRDEVFNRSDDGEAPEELTERTERIIDARRWLNHDAM
ncbi:hypothetical protein GCM10022234_21840 [Aeromicrobium panaciterrae]|uniref:LysM peptidoglycan-binding domain-containing protein n=1 Tax=Aeromicrobium panaciterrae TaxID=363861 RepID=UPI0031DED2B9